MCTCLRVCLAARSSSARPQSGGQHHGQRVAIPNCSLPATAATAPALMLRMHAQQAHIRTHPWLAAGFSGRAYRTAAVAQWLCGGQTHAPSSVAALRSKECALRSELLAVARTHHVRMLGAGEDDIWVNSVLERGRGAWAAKGAKTTAPPQARPHGGNAPQRWLTSPGASPYALLLPQPRKIARARKSSTGEHGAIGRRETGDELVTRMSSTCHFIGGIP